MEARQQAGPARDARRDVTWTLVSRRMDVRQ
jgi:hypothetical protein